jgi:hypothetical protein
VIWAKSRELHKIPGLLYFVNSETRHREELQ